MAIIPVCSQTSRRRIEKYLPTRARRLPIDVVREKMFHAKVTY